MRRRFCRGLTFGTLALIAVLNATTANAVISSIIEIPKRDLYSSGDFGGVGLLQTRTARFGHDGQFTVGSSLVNPYRRYYVNWQIFPWAEVTFRYTDITNVGAFSPYAISDQSQSTFFGDFFSLDQGGTFLDRGFDLKISVLRESKYGPAVAVGFQDFLGTGLFSGEYVVFSKRFGNWDFHAGIGWGYLATRNTVSNPLINISNRFENRSRKRGQGGSLGFSQYFSGSRAGVFGGLEYHTPIDGVSLKIEYSSADPANEPLSNALNESFPINVGLNYRIGEWADISLGWERGNSLLINFALRYNMNTSMPPKFDNGPVTHAREKKPKENWRDPVLSPTTGPPMGNLERQLSLFGLSLKKLLISGKNAELKVTGRAFPDRPDFDARVAYALFDTLHRDVETVDITMAGSLSIKTLNRKDWFSQDTALAPEQLARRIFGGFSFRVRHVEQNNTVLAVQLDAPDWARERDYRIAADLIFEQSDSKLEAIAIKSTSRTAGERRFYAYNPFLALRPAPEPPEIEWKEHERIAQDLFTKLNGYGYQGYALSIEGSAATIYITAVKTLSVGRNLGRISRTATQSLPDQVDTITVVILSFGTEVSRVSVLRHDIEQAAQSSSHADEIQAHATIFSPEKNITFSEHTVRNNEASEKFSWGLGPSIRHHIGDPGEGLYKIDLLVNATASYKIMPNLRITGTLSRFIVGNISDITRTSNSLLPRVRSDIVEYVQEGRTAITQLQISYVTKLAENYYFRLTAGLLEPMYGGIGVEVLYKPPLAPWAVSVDINWVQQRDYDQLFKFRDYDVVTGHLNLSYRLPYRDVTVSISAGKYLAKDWGATFQVARRFKSGIVVGGFFTLTSASAVELGEGSFDKGFFIRIPLDALSINHSRAGSTLFFRPLTRDGGQRVNVGPRLIGMANSHDAWRLNETWRDFMH